MADIEHRGLSARVSRRLFCLSVVVIPLLLLTLQGCPGSGTVHRRASLDVSVAELSIAGLHLGVTKARVRQVLGVPEEIIVTEGGCVVWDYPTISILFENDRAIQLLGDEPLLFQGKVVNLGLMQDELCVKLGLPEGAIRYREGVQSLDLKDGSLSLGFSGARTILMGISCEPQALQRHRGLMPRGKT